MTRRFCRYIEKVFHWSEKMQTLTDSRKMPQILTKTVFMSAMMMFVCRLGSLNAIEQRFRRDKSWRMAAGKRLPSADRIGKVMALVGTEQLRDLLSGVNHRLKRNKLLDKSPWSLRVLALDGHEFFSQC